MKAYKLALPLLAATTVLCTGVGVANAEEPADCGAASTVLTTAQRDLDEAKADDEKAEKAKDADRAFDRADRDLRDAQRRLDRANDAVNATPDVPATEAELREQRSAEKAVREATDERDRTRKQADKENADQLQRKADRTDADELKKAVDEAQEDVNRLCGGATTATPTPAPENDVDCDEVGAAEAQRILDADRNDPNNLDEDKDGIACEVDEILPDTDDNAGTSGSASGDVVVPNGGVNTGVGPA